MHLSPTFISNEATLYYLTASFHVHLFVREMMCWWLACTRKKMWWWIASFCYSYYNGVLQYCLAATILAAAAKSNITTTHASSTWSCYGVKRYSVTKITNAAICYYCATTLYYAHLFVRESWLWHVLLPRLDSYSYFGDALQNGKQLFSARLPLMTKYFVMREYENILSAQWISLCGDYSI